MKFEIGDLIIIQLALVFYFKDVDLSLSAAQQIQGTIAKTELAIQQINTAAQTQNSQRPVPEPPTKPAN